ncbi:MAG: hypothetical protein M1835_002410 [Candelina submexicana]|nr:MAG: hypothetical protein M1835_002410 [Candelina submexicana]
MATYPKEVIGNGDGSPDASNSRHADLNERAIFDYLIHPDDMYDENGVYWADLPVMKQIKFVTSTDSKETRRELGVIGRMIKKDPLSPVGAYFRNMVLPGAGLGLEGYVLFSIGNVKPLFQKAFPTCWADSGKKCNHTWIQAVEYLEVMGIIVGQILVGIIGDWLGRRWGLIQDATIMFLGLVMLVASWGTTLNGWVICYALSLFVYGVGVGGEYPMTATSGMENATGSGKISTKDDRLHRGRKVTSAFLMQGWGQLANQAVLILLLLCFHHGSGNAPYSKVAAQWVYRVSFAIPAVGTLWLVYYRAYKMKSASKQLAAAKKKSKVTGYDTQSLKLTFTYFGPRLIATAGGWFCNDIFFYGNKLFQSEFISVITKGGSSIMPGWLYNLINVGVSLVGYYLASFLIDNKLYGRRRMQQVGFLMDFILLIIPAFRFKHYTAAPHIKEFQALYFLSSFFNQFGPNSVTFLVAAEVFPTPIRATAHGFSAAVGKLGALTPAILYNYIDNQTKFLVGPWFGLIGMILTWLFLPDTTGLDLKEQERRWQYIHAGREEDYHGIAIHPRHLSTWERWRGVGKHYDADLDYKQKIDEMRSDWEHSQARKHAEKEGTDDEDHHEETDAWSDSVSTYFERTSGKSPLIQPNEKKIYESS